MKCDARFLPTARCVPDIFHDDGKCPFRCALRGENRASPRLGAGGQGSSSAELSVLPPPPRKTKSAASLLLGERRRLPLALFFFRAHQAVPQPEVDALLFQKFLVG